MCDYLYALSGSHGSEELNCGSCLRCCYTEFRRKVEAACSCDAFCKDV